MKVLVVGGAGYIGSIAAELLIHNGHDVVVFDNLSRGHRAAVPEDAEFIHGDLASDKDLERAFATKPQAIMHFAALSLVGESVQQPAIYFGNNVVNGIRLLDKALANGVKKIVFSSSAAVYGQPSNCPIDEDSPLSPTNPYGDSKLAFETVLKWYSQAYGLSYASLRYFNAAGATQTRGEDHAPESHLIPILLDVAQGLLPSATVFGDDYETADGTCVRDYIHVSDLAEAHLLALNALAEMPVQIYNLGSEQGFTVKQVVEAARQVTQKPIPTVVGPRRAGDPPALVASSERIRKALGWAPTRTNLSTMIGDAWRWQLAHPHGYKREQVHV